MAKRAFPIKYSPDMVDSICARIGAGESLNQICKEKGLPKRTTVLGWMQKHPYLNDKYAKARLVQADFYADQIIEIADNPKIEYQRARVMIDARKWKACKMHPRNYGDKVAIDHSGTIETMSKEQVEARIAELERRGQSRALRTTEPLGEVRDDSGPDED